MPAGHPKVSICRQELLQQCRAGKSKKAIAEYFGISRQTLARILADENIDSFQRHNPTDGAIDEETIKFKCLMPNAGERLVVGHFRSAGFNIQRWRIRSSIHRVDQPGVGERTERVQRRIHRRIYGSPFPHYCWHIDGNHKLIRWGLVIHCAIDGFSRTCTFLQCSNNNRSSTVLQYFMDACENFGVPIRVRTDHGGENKLIWEAMLEISNGNNPHPVTVGSSVHNQRVERFNRDINTHIRQHFGLLFYSFERYNILDVENPLHLAALHYVYIPRINRVLRALQDSHNNHPIRTENNRTPLQMIEQFRFLGDHYDGESAEYTINSINALPQNPVSVAVNSPDIDDEGIVQLSDLNVHAEDGVEGKSIYLLAVNRLTQLD